MHKYNQPVIITREGVKVYFIIPIKMSLMLLES